MVNESGCLLIFNFNIRQPYITKIDIFKLRVSFSEEHNRVNNRNAASEDSVTTNIKSNLKEENSYDRFAMSLDDSIHRKVPIRDRIDRSSNGYQENFSIRKSSVNHSDRQRERIEIETVANSKIRYNIRRTNFTPFVFYIL